MKQGGKKVHQNSNTKDFKHQGKGYSQKSKFQSEVNKSEEKKNTNNQAKISTTNSLEKSQLKRINQKEEEEKVNIKVNEQEFNKVTEIKPSEKKSPEKTGQPKNPPKEIKAQEEAKISKEICNLCKKSIKQEIFYTPKCTKCFYCKDCLINFEKYKGNLKYCLDCSSYFRKFMQKDYRKKTECTLCMIYEGNFNLLCDKHPYCLECFSFIEKNNFNHIRTISKCEKCKECLKKKKFKFFNIPNSQKPQENPRNSTNDPENVNYSGSSEKNKINPFQISKNDPVPFYNQPILHQNNPEKRMSDVEGQKIGSPRKTYEYSNNSEKNKPGSPRKTYEYSNNSGNSDKSQINATEIPNLNQKPLDYQTMISQNYTEHSQGKQLITSDKTIQDTFHIRAMNFKYICPICHEEKPLVAFLCKHNVCFDCLAKSCWKDIKNFFLEYSSNPNKIYQKFCYFCPNSDCSKNISVPTKMIYNRLKILFSSDSRIEYNDYQLLMIIIDWIPYLDGLEYCLAYNSLVN